ncbi:carboxypeptidase-like regulatory domain-containing protein [Aquimarina sp. 2-A2]|uniref:carboxypeptidase-like regulatory domain-containing protein n=1 Tax=Aquimarina sp. 2-A2 TaxID=3382644 RepID=UPI00387F0364
MKIKILLLFFIISKLLTAQVVGKVTDIEGTPLPYVNIYIENTYLGTTTNEDGNYAIETNLNTEQTLVFQFLGFKTLKKKVTPHKILIS